jgi:hypothetical protein
MYDEETGGTLDEHILRIALLLVADLTRSVWHRPLRIRQHTSAYVYACLRHSTLSGCRSATARLASTAARNAYVSVCQHTSTQA